MERVDRRYIAESLVPPVFKPDADHEVLGSSPKRSGL
jgi:hypothetical protein